MNNVLELVHAYSKIKGKISEMFPYRLNIIDELHIDENAHSRILCKLLSHRDNNNYPSCLLNFIKKMLEKL